MIYLGRILWLFVVEQNILCECAYFLFIELTFKCEYKPRYFIFTELEYIINYYYFVRIVICICKCITEIRNYFILEKLIYLRLTRMFAKPSIFLSIWKMQWRKNYVKIRLPKQFFLRSGRLINYQIKFRRMILSLESTIFKYLLDFSYNLIIRIEVFDMNCISIEL